MKEGRIQARRDLPPYGPAKGMLTGLQLIGHLSPARVDEALLRRHQVAPRNEYKVIGALRYLGLIDEEGRPTEASRLLKIRGAAYTLNLQNILRQAYKPLFETFDLEQASRDDLYNYFVTKEGLGSEMATKATRFFIDLCKLAEIRLGQGVEVKRGRKPGQRSTKRSTPIKQTNITTERTALPLQFPVPFPSSTMPSLGPSFPLVLTLPPDILNLDEEGLTAFFRRLHRALSRALAP